MSTFHRISMILVSIGFAASLGLAQSSTIAAVDEHRSEAGIFYTGLNLKGFGETVNGIGGRFGYNLNKHFAIDSEFSFFPETKLGNHQFGQKTQALIGIKAGVRTGHVGVFAKARPGVMFVGELTSGFSCSSSSTFQICRPSHSNLAVDLGGVLEYYPSPRTLVRFDAGDTVVRLQSANGLTLGGSTTVTRTSNNFQFSVGVGFRF